MKTKKNKKTKRGGILGIRALKTKSENRENCHRLADNFKKRDAYLHNRFNCAKQSSPECRLIGTQLGIHHECANSKMIDSYDFSRDGQQVKQRIQPFFGSDTVPLFVNGEPWNKMPYHFKKNPNALSEYVLKSDEI